MPFYIVDRIIKGGIGTTRIIEAPNQAAALRYCTRSDYCIRAASQQDLVWLLSTDKIEVERVSNDASAD